MARLAAPTNVSIHTADPEEAMCLGGAVYYPHRYTKVATSNPFAMGLDAICLGPVTVGVISYDVDLSLQTEALGAYQVNVPLSGSLHSTSRGVEVQASQRSAAVYQPSGDARLRCRGRHSSFVGIKFEAAALETQLASLLDAPVSRQVDLPAQIDLSTGPAAAWWALVRPLTEMKAHSTLMANSMVARPYVESLTAGLLLALPHQYSDRLNRPVPAASHPAVRRAVERIESSPRHPWTPIALAADACIGVRALQAGFRRELGTSIMQHVEQVRLAHARRELLAADPTHTSVTRIANQWGFTHLSRFAGRYQTVYGENPSTTLRR
jgi:AraC-like DNA-binding protein